MSSIQEWAAIQNDTDTAEIHTMAVQTAADNASQTLKDEGVIFANYSDAVQNERWCYIATLTYGSQIEA